MFVRNDMTVDARVLKEAASLRDAGHAVTIIGITRPGTPHEIEREPRDGFEIVRVPLPRWRRWWRWLRAPSRLLVDGQDAVAARPRGLPDGRPRLARDVAVRDARLGPRGGRAAGRADVYHGHDLTGLPAAVFARRLHDPAARLVYDSHELYLDSAATVGRPAWAVNWLARREREWSSEADALVTVTDGTADHLRRRLAIARVVVVHNCPPRPTGPLERTTLVRDALGLPATPEVVLYTGGLPAGPRARGAGRGDARARARGGPSRVPRVRAARAATSRRSPPIPRFGGRLHLLPPCRRSTSCAGCRRRRGRDADPGDEPELRALDAEQAVRGFAAGVPVVGSDFPGMRAIVVDEPRRPARRAVRPDVAGVDRGGDPADPRPAARRVPGDGGRALPGRGRALELGDRVGEARRALSRPRRPG